MAFLATAKSITTSIECSSCMQTKPLDQAFSKSQRKKHLKGKPAKCIECIESPDSTPPPPKISRNDSQLLDAAENISSPPVVAVENLLESQHSNIDYWLVMDYEATCLKDSDRSWKNEIIEWPCVLVCTKTYQIVDEFRSMVRPTEEPILTPFCTQLTSIQQTDVANAPTLKEVIVAFDGWLESHGISESGALSVWCGDWDLKTCLPRECRRKGLYGVVPPVLKNWCNAKFPFNEVTGSRKRKGMDGMLETLGLELTGHHHLGIDDARNIAKMVCELARRGGNQVIAPTSSTPDAAIYRKRRRQDVCATID